MKIFTIESETNNITAHTTVEAAEAEAGAERFRNEAGLAKLAAKWPVARLVEIWNSLPGVTPVKKFKDRETAVARIWKAIQGLAPTEPMEIAQQPEVEAASIETAPEPPPVATPEAPQTGDVAPVGASSPKKASRAKKAPKLAQNTKPSREGSKTATVLELLKREGGVSAQELMNATGWQAHSVRGVLSGTVGKKMGLTVISAKGEDGARSYSVKA